MKKVLSAIVRFLFYRWMHISYTWIEASTGQRLFGETKIQCVFFSVPFNYIKKKLLEEGHTLQDGRTFIILSVYKYPMIHINQ